MKAAKRASIRASIASVLGRAWPKLLRKRGRDWDARDEGAGRVGPRPASGGAHNRQSVRRPWRGSLAPRVRLRLRQWRRPCWRSAWRGPHYRRCRANPSKHRPRCTRGLQQWKDRLKPTGDELPWRTFRKKGKVLWRRIVTRGGPGLPFALKTEKGRTTDRDCLRTRVPSRFDLAVPPAILTADAKPPKNSRSKRTIQRTWAPYGVWIATPP